MLMVPSPSPLLREENINTTTLDMYLSTHRRSSTPTIDTPPSLCSLSIYLCLLSRCAYHSLVQLRRSFEHLCPPHMFIPILRTRTNVPFPFPSSLYLLPVPIQVPYIRSSPSLVRWLRSFLRPGCLFFYPSLVAMHVYEWLEKENAFLLHCFDSFNVGDVGVRVALWALVEIIFIPISFRRVLVSLSILLPLPRGAVLVYDIKVLLSCASTYIRISVYCIRVME